LNELYQTEICVLCTVTPPPCYRVTLFVSNNSSVLCAVSQVFDHVTITSPPAFIISEYFFLRCVTRCASSSDGATGVLLDHHD